ncbi:MAG: hypothetical protein WB615_00335 [Candidatus Tumulicola sp.]
MPVPPTTVTLVLNVPVTTQAPQVTVTPMAPGTYTFALIVGDNAGGQSAPATHQVTVSAANPNR